MVHGKPRHSQSQGSVERANQEVQNALITWMERNNCSRWSKALPMVQQMLNCRLHSAINAFPYQLVFNRETAADLIPSIPKCLLGDTNDETKENEAFLNNDLSSETDQNSEIDFQTKEPLTKSNVSLNSEDLTPLCIVCNKPVGGAHTCSTCKLQVHAICGKLLDENEEGYGSMVTCNICLAKLHHEQNLLKAKQQSDAQANRMLRQTKKVLSDVKVGQCVMIKVPTVDRSNISPRNAIGIVCDIRKKMFEIGTIHGIIDRLYSRRQFDLCSESFLSVDQVPKNNCSLREAAGVSTCIGSQGFVMCKSTQDCNNNRCKCKKRNAKCNSKCKHSGRSCKNITV